MKENNHEEQYTVVVNGKGEYSIWPLDKVSAPGWENDGHTGSKSECLDYINCVWKNMVLG